MKCYNSYIHVILKFKKMPHANRMSRSLHVSKRQLVASLNEQSLLSVVVDGLQQGF